MLKFFKRLFHTHNFKLTEIRTETFRCGVEIKYTFECDCGEKRIETLKQTFPSFDDKYQYE